MFKTIALVAGTMATLALADWLGASPVIMMALASLAIIPIAAQMGQATEQLTYRVGPTVGGLVNATFGNACELIIAILALRAGLIDVVKASITGSIIGNLLLVMGGSMIAGGLKHETQAFNRLSATTAYVFLSVASFSLMIPAAMYTFHTGLRTYNAGMALAVSGVLLALYLLGLLFSLKTHKHLFTPVIKDDPEEIAKSWPVWRSLVVLALTTGALMFLSGYLVDNVTNAANSLGMTPVFVGVILVAVIGNAAENSTAIAMARKNKLDISINICLGSSMQISMFVAPILVLAGVIMGQPMDLIFPPAEILAVFAAVFVMTLALQDGKSNWLEGASLLGLWLILAICFYWLP